MTELKEKGLSLNRIMNNLDINNPICSCFITAYTNETTSGLQNPSPEELEKYNQEQNDSLESDLRHLQLTGYKKIFGGYTYGTDNKIKAEPGFIVSANIKNVDPDEFKEEMIALGKRYKQESILMKIPGEKVGYYDTFNNYGNKNSTFTSVKKIAPTKYLNKYPNDPEAWQYGYTQLAKDLRKDKDQGFSLTDNAELDEMNLDTLILTEEEINTITESSGMHGVPTMSMAILKMITRKRLGLNPNFKCK